MVVLDLVWTTDLGNWSAIGNGEEAFEMGENMDGAEKCHNIVIWGSKSTQKSMSGLFSGVPPLTQ